MMVCGPFEKEPPKSWRRDGRETCFVVAYSLGCMLAFVRGMMGWEEMIYLFLLSSSLTVKVFTIFSSETAGSEEAISELREKLILR